ncbi:MAG: alpha/beta hydrolase [bacterium]|nr:alpha/beta hydrolase [bacterium]
MKVVVQNLAMEYADEGSGPVVLLLHGWKNDLHTFDSLLPFLISSFRVIRVDLPGFGGSEAPKKAWGVGEYVAFVEAFGEKLGIAVEVLIGHSFGGRIAIKGVGTGELHPKKVILIGSAGLPKHNSLRNRMFKVLAKVGKAVTFVLPASIRENLRQRLYQKAGSNDYLTAGALKETSVRVIGEDLSGYATQIKVPTLLIWGGDDTATPFSDGKRLHVLIRGSILESIQGAGHFVHQEKPEKVAELIKKFVV